MKFPEPIGPYKKIGCYDYLSGTGKQNSVLFRLFYPTDLLHTTNSNKYFTVWQPKKYRKSYNRVMTLAGTFMDNFYDGQKLNCQDQTFLTEMMSEIQTLEPDSGPETLHESSQQKIPIIFFSHGLCGNRFVYSQNCVNLASLGYLVLAPEHRDESSSHSFYLDEKTLKQKSVKYQDMKIMDNDAFLKEHAWNKEHHAIRNSQLNFRVQEIRKSLDILKLLNGQVTEPKELDRINKTSRNNSKTDLFYNYLNKSKFLRLKNRLDFENISIVGHSFGAATAMRTVGEFPPNFFKKIIVMDFWTFPVNYQEIANLREHHSKENYLFLNSTPWFSIPFTTKLYSILDLQQPNLYHFKNIMHQTFSDMAHLAFNKYWPKKWYGKQFGWSDYATVQKLIYTCFLKFLAGEKIEVNSEFMEFGLVDDGFCKNLEQIQKNYEFMVENQVSV